ncbi:hypothetical protein NQU17_15420 [Clostridiaceae bacterium HFYG-1003]|nr:hypothetical protein NQU17_15420 [Clostridiaceae bacterium HFYG-1003]
MKNKIILLLIGIAILASLIFLARPFIFNEYLVNTKDLSTIEEIDVFLKDSSILIPSYSTNKDNPHLHTSKESVSIERSKQYGAWDGYNIVITPTKLSDSSFFQIFISSSKVINEKNEDVKWTVSNANSDFQPGENYPEGEYTRVIGTFQRGNNLYEITGYSLGPMNNTKEKQLISELQYFVDSMN